VIFTTETRSHGEARRNSLSIHWALAVMLFLGTGVWAQDIPHVEAETLSGKKIVLPDAAADHPAIFIIGFSRAGGDSSGRWGKDLRKELASNADLRFFSIAILQDAPKLMRGVIKHGMRGGVPKAEQDSFIVLERDEDVWKKLADFSDPNDAYVILTDSYGKIRWRTHGNGPDTQTVNALKNELAQLASTK